MVGAMLSQAAHSPQSSAPQNHNTTLKQPQDAPTSVAKERSHAEQDVEGAILCVHGRHAVEQALHAPAVAGAGQQHLDGCHVGTQLAFAQSHVVDIERASEWRHARWRAEMRRRVRVSCSSEDGYDAPESRFYRSCIKL